MSTRGGLKKFKPFGNFLALFAISITSIIFQIPHASAAACTPEVTISGSYTVVAFKTVGTCTWATPAGTNVFRGLIIAGGGGGGSAMGGGGGGGGYVEFDSLTVTNDVLTIVVGDGGLGAVGYVAGSSGGNSSIAGSGIALTSRGGAGGSTDYASNSYLARTNGGSGGGSSGANDYPGAYPQDRSSLGTQTSQTQYPSLSTIGGNQFGGDGGVPGARWHPGGGGGAGGNGLNTPGIGGAGRANAILGTSYIWAGGGGGSGWTSAGGNGGTGGGGGGGSGNVSAGVGGIAGTGGLNVGSNGAYIGGAGAANTGGGGGAGTHSGYSGGNGGSGIVILRYLTFASPTSFTSLAAPYTNSSSPITFSITFSQNVDSVTASDFSNVGTATGCILAINASSGTTFTLTATGCSEGTLIPQVLAGSVYGTATGTNGPTTNSPTTTPVTIDRTVPTISSVSGPANKTYIPSETPTFSVVFSESITVVGSPRLQLTVGALTKYANYVSMSDSKTALFRYTVGTATGEFDTDGIELNTTFDVNGGRIDDLAGNSMTLTTITAPVLTSVLVAQKASAPTITSITPGSTQLTVNFNAGASNGASITNYKYSLNGGAFTAASPVDTVTPLVITGLTNGTGYTIRILAVTLAGDGDSSTAVTETPSAILVTGDSTIVLTYGTSGSTGNYSASGGTNVFTWSLGSVISGVTLSGTSVSVANTLNAGTYTQTVRATDGASAVGSKQLTITINKASSTISLALQSGGNSTPVGQSPVITITTARAGTVVFTAGGQVVAACSSISIASTSGTCTLPAPGGTGSLSLDAVFTPTSGNFDSATASISITIVDGVSTVTLSLAGGVVEVPKGQSINIIAAIDQAGKVSFYVDGKRLPGCFNKTFSAGNAVCAWKPAAQKTVSIRATLDPTNNVYNNSSSTLGVLVKRRAGLR